LAGRRGAARFLAGRARAAFFAGRLADFFAAFLADFFAAFFAVFFAAFFAVFRALFVAAFFRTGADAGAGVAGITGRSGVRAGMA
jgi:hypothetical protein